MRGYLPGLTRNETEVIIVPSDREHLFTVPPPQDCDMNKEGNVVGRVLQSDFGDCLIIFLDGRTVDFQGEEGQLR